MQSNTIRHIKVIKLQSNNSPLFDSTVLFGELDINLQIVSNLSFFDIIKVNYKTTEKWTQDRAPISRYADQFDDKV